MKKAFITAGMVIVALSSSLAFAAPARLEGALEARRVRMSAQLTAGQKEKVDSAVKDVRASPPTADLMAVARKSLGPIQGMNIDALAFLVLMQSAKASQDEIAEVSADLQALNRKKAAVRAALAARKAARRPCADLSCVSAIAPTADFTKADIDFVKAQLDAKADSTRDGALSDMTQDMQMKEAMLVSRRQKLEEALSNILKKVATTSEAIIANEK